MEKETASKAVRKRKRRLTLSKAQSEKEALEQSKGLAQIRQATHKEVYLKQLDKNLGLYHKTARDLGICRRTPERWRKDDPEFNDACIKIQLSKLDMVEGHLIKNITEGNFHAQKFYLRCKGNLTPQGDTPTGWVERIEVAGVPDAPLGIVGSIEVVREAVTDTALSKALAKAMKATPDLFSGKKKGKK